MRQKTLKNKAKILTFSALFLTVTVLGFSLQSLSTIKAEQTSQTASNTNVVYSFSSAGLSVSNVPNSGNLVSINDASILIPSNVVVDANSSISNVQNVYGLNNTEVGKSVGVGQIQFKQKAIQISSAVAMNFNFKTTHQNISAVQLQTNNQAAMISLPAVSSSGLKVALLVVVTAIASLYLISKKEDYLPTLEFQMVGVMRC